MDGLELTDEQRKRANQGSLVENAAYAASGGAGGMSAEQALRDYQFWITRVRELIDAGHRRDTSEVLRGDEQMAYRALGRYDILSRLGR